MLSDTFLSRLAFFQQIANSSNDAPSNKTSGRLELPLMKREN